MRGAGFLVAKTAYSNQTRTAGALKTKARLAPELIQNLQVLVMPVAELESYVADAAERNPLLEVNYDNEIFSFEAIPVQGQAEGEDPSDFSPATGEAASAAQEGSWRRLRMESGAFEWDFSRIQDQYVETETLHSYLRLQQGALNLDAQDSQVMAALIEAVDDDGYFSGSVGQVAFELDADIDRVKELLETLQGFQPLGVAARTLEECLIAQVSPSDPQRNLIVDLIENHLKDIATGHQGFVAKGYGVSNQELTRALASIRELNPKPGADFYQRPDCKFVVPDITVTCDGGHLEARVLGSQVPCFTYNSDYLAMLGSQQLPADARRFLEQCSTDAKQVIDGLEQRNNMLERLAEVLIKRQGRYFVTGGRVLAPMTMKDVAQDLGVHVSVVSRAVSGKYLQAPWGSVSLKSLFTRAIPKKAADGKAQVVSSADVKSMILALVEREPAEHPHSDQDICNILNGNGVDIKRRTVAKYRIALGIEPQSARRWANRTRTESA